MKPIRRLLPLLFVCLAIGAAAGCGSDGPKVTEKKSNASTSTTEKKQDAQKAAKQYFDAFVTSNPAKMKTMLDLSQPGSVAAAYATQQIAATQAFIDDGSPRSESSLVVDGGSIKTCEKNSTSDNSCITFSDFVADSATGKLVSFKANGQDLGPRLVVGTDQGATAFGANVKLVSAYQSVQGQRLLIVLEVRGGPDAVSVGGYSAKYVDANGRQSEVQTSAGSTDLAANATTNVLLAFSDVAPGGRLLLPVSRKSDYESQDLEIPIPAPTPG